MPKTLTTLLAGAAVLFAAGGAAAFAPDPVQDSAAAARQAAQDARAAADKARESAKVARAKAEDAREQARREVRVYRGGPGSDVYVFRGGDRSEHLRTILQLRPDQEVALKTYLDAAGSKDAANRDAVYRFDRKDGAATTMQRLDQMEQKLADQQAAMRRRIDATKAFYGQLDDKQKKVFDALPMLMFAGPGFGPMLMPINHMHAPPEPPLPPLQPKPPAPPRGL